MPPQPGERIWIRVTVDCPHEAADAVSDRLHDLSPNGLIVSEDDEAHLTGFMGPYASHEAAPDARARVQRALSAIPHDLLPRPIRLTTRPVPEQDWFEVFRGQHHATRIGRTVVKPTWESWPSPDLPSRPDDIVVEIDPGLAFGTGQHPTTELCLQQLQDRLRRGDRVVDLGCGSGILTIAAAKLGAREVLALDRSFPAATVARENVLRNDVQDRARVAVADSLDAVRPGWDLIVANINPVVVARAAPAAARVLHPGGCYICTGVPLSRENEVLEALRDCALDVSPRYHGDWIGFVCTTPGGEKQ